MGAALVTLVTWAALGPIDGGSALVPARAIIWGGGATREDGLAAMKVLEADSEMIRSRLRLAAGFPKLVESRSVTGLKPGFHVVVLGWCQPDEALAPLALLKALNDKVYMRSVAVEALACPGLDHGWTVVDAESSGPLTVLALGESQQSLFFAAILEDPQGGVRDFKKTDPVCPSAVSVLQAAIEVSGGEVTAIAGCESPGCTTLAQDSIDLTFRVRKGRITLVDDSSSTPGACD